VPGTASLVCMNIAHRPEFVLRRNLQNLGTLQVMATIECNSTTIIQKDLRNNSSRIVTPMNFKNTHILFYIFVQTDSVLHVWEERRSVII
jgi:ABC-type enterochelin transport system permease subunit